MKDVSTLDLRVIGHDHGQERQANDTPEEHPVYNPHI
jgi:hypothetical protein